MQRHTWKYFKISSKSFIVLPTPQELNKESKSFVYKIWVGAARVRKPKTFLYAPSKEYKAISDFDPHKTVIGGYKTVITDNCGPTALQSAIFIFEF